MIVTNHAKDRMKERVGSKSKTIEKTAQRALQKGINHSEVHGSLSRYIDSLVLKGNYKATKIRIYNNYVWLFNSKDILITVMDIPQKYRKLATRLQQEHKKEV